MLNKGSWMQGMDQRNREIDGMEDALRIFRDSLHSAVQKPESFWNRQREEIFIKIRRPVPKRRVRLVLIWASALATVLLCITVFIEKNKMPAASFAGGYDQELLVEVERALNRNYAEVLSPAVVFSDELTNTGKKYLFISK
jgi:hypothetical protein